MNRTIAFIGLGNMGAPMALNLVKSGFNVVTYDHHKENVHKLVNAGAKGAASLTEAVEDADFIITILPRDENVLDAYLSNGGIVEAAKPDAICIEMTSARGETIKMVAEKVKAQGKAISFLDAPVSGGVQGAENAALTIMCGGEQQVFEVCKPILDALGKKTFYTGDLGSGKAVKMVNQLLNAGNTLVAAEAVYLAKSLNLDMERILDIVKESSGNSWVFSNNVGKHMLQESYEGGFRLELLKKDVALSMTQIEADNISLPVSELVFKMYELASQKGHDKQNYNVVYDLIKSLNNK